MPTVPVSGLPSRSFAVPAKRTSRGTEEASLGLLTLEAVSWATATRPPNSTAKVKVETSRSVRGFMEESPEESGYRFAAIGEHIAAKDAAHSAPGGWIMQEKVFPARPPAAPMGVPSSDGFVLVRTAEKRPRRRAPRPRKRYSREDNYTHHGVALGT